MKNKNNALASVGTNGITSPKAPANLRLSYPSFPRLQIESDLIAHARNIAEESGHTQVNDEIVGKLTSHAESMADAAYREEFDPIGIESDRLRLEEFEENECGIPDLRRAEAEAAVVVREQEIVVAETPSPPGDPGEISPYFAVVAGVGLCGSVYPAIHDVLPSLATDETTRMLLALLLAAALTAAVTYAVLYMPRRGWAKYLGLGGGILMAIGLAALRLLVTPEPLYALILFLLEVSILLILEAFAAAHSAAQDAYLERKIDHDREAAKLDALREQHEGRLADLNTALESRAGFHNYVEDRFARRYHGEQLKNSARESVETGYMTRVEANRSRVLGPPRQHILKEKSSNEES